MPLPFRNFLFLSPLLLLFFPMLFDQWLSNEDVVTKVRFEGAVGFFLLGEVLAWIYVPYE